jgi:Flp pilus assembly protein TadB
VYPMLSVSLDCFCFVFLRLVYTMLSKTMKNKTNTIQRNWQHRVHKTNKHKTKTIQRNWQHSVHKTKKNTTKQSRESQFLWIVFVLFFFVLCTLCCQFLSVFVLFFFVSCTLCCQFLWIVFVLFLFVLCTTTQDTQDEEKRNKNNPVKLTTYGTQDEWAIKHGQSRETDKFFFVLCILCCQFL